MPEQPDIPNDADGADGAEPTTQAPHNGASEPKNLDEPPTRREISSVINNALQQALDAYILDRPMTVQLAVLGVEPVVQDVTIPDATGAGRPHKVIKSRDPFSGINVDLVLGKEQAEELGRKLTAPKVNIARSMPGGLPDLGSLRR